MVHPQHRAAAPAGTGNSTGVRTEGTRPALTKAVKCAVTEEKAIYVKPLLKLKTL